MPGHLDRATRSPATLILPEPVSDQQSGSFPDPFELGRVGSPSI
jgi:hypothetical protein